MAGGAGMSECECTCVQHPDHFSMESTLLITCPPFLIEDLLNIWPPLMYSSSPSWLSLGDQCAALYLGRIPFMCAHAGAGSAAPTQGKPWSSRQEQSSHPCHWVFYMHCKNSALVRATVCMRSWGTVHHCKKNHCKWMENQLGNVMPTFRHLILLKTRPPGQIFRREKEALKIVCLRPESGSGRTYWYMQQ